MNTLFRKYDEKTGEILSSALYSNNTKQALINYIMQELHNDYNTWNYPEHIDGIKESSTKQGVLYFETKDFIIQAIPE